ncbi:MAG: outer membrane protein assembly factor BamE [Candidatus Tectomicrobia bacterium]|nr:outer membrane protein assembly factor BamE [Candidatus Tectomicrobia bacterium]
MKRIVQSLALVLLAALVVGCAARGRDFDQQVVLRIEKGKTTKAQVQDWLGSPHERGMQGEFETWTYRFMKNLGPFTQEQTKELTVWFEKAGVVNTYSYTTNHAPWQVSR